MSQPFPPPPVHYIAAFCVFSFLDTFAKKRFLVCLFFCVFSSASLFFKLFCFMVGHISRCLYPCSDYPISSWKFIAIVSVLYKFHEVEKGNLFSWMNWMKFKQQITLHKHNCAWTDVKGNSNIACRWNVIQGKLSHAFVFVCVCVC